MSPSATVNAEVINALRDIRGPVAIPGEWLWLWVLAAGLIALVMGVWGVRFFKRAPAAAVVPADPAWKTALDAMVALERAGYIQQGRIKEYYSELSGIVRRYIEERLEVRAPEMTTEEFMHAVRYSDRMTALQQGFLRDFLNASDMVKFARFIPSVEEMFQALRLARAFVEETR